MIYSGIRRVTLALSAALLFSYIALARGSDVVAEPNGYRMEDYDAAVPTQLTGATWVDAIGVKRLQQEQAALIIDVIPEYRKPDFLPKNQLWVPPAHIGIAGSIWLPDIGYGALSEATIKYFIDNLERHTKLELDYPMVFYCRMDCWMSWNAAKRALSFGYTNIYWYADGITGWEFEDNESSVLIAEPGVRQ